jgi:uncharacterized protein (TIGR01777 family)
MDIAITGSTGLIGTQLAASLRADGHTVVPVVRTASQPGTLHWDPMSGSIERSGFEGIDAVVHLAGEPIAAGRWSAPQRDRIRDSRRIGTDLLARTLAELDRPPSTLVSGSAIGWYGSRGDEVLTEASASGDDFLAEVCREWEGATAPAEAAGLRVVHLRTGIVLDPRGGALAAQLPIFRLGLGGKAGAGDQWLAWISLADEVRAIRFALDQPELSGPVNLSAPNPVTNEAFTRALGAQLRRPTFMRIPRLARHLPLGIGPLVDSLLFSSARVVPEVLVGAGFSFDHETLDAALADLLG